jgi:hypothetical protein
MPDKECVTLALTFAPRLLLIVSMVGDRPAILRFARDTARGTALL